MMNRFIDQDEREFTVTLNLEQLHFLQGLLIPNRDEPLHSSTLRALNTAYGYVPEDRKVHIQRFDDGSIVQ